MAAVALTLFDVEEGLTALLDSAELVAPDQEQAFLEDFEHALNSAADKRDRVAGRIAKLEAQQEYAAAEIKRLQAFKKSREADQARLEGYVSYVIQRLGKDAKDKWRKLEGHTSSMFLRACAPSVEVTDESLIPIDYRSVTVTLPATTWEDILNTLPNSPWRCDIAKCKTETAPDKRAIKAAIEAGVTIDGAKLVSDKTTLGRK